MIYSLRSDTKIFVCREPTDMRKSFTGLVGLADQLFDDSPTSGHLFVFCNRRGNRMKILYFDGDGYVIWYKCLEQGTFRLPTTDGATISMFQLGMILSGVSADRLLQHKRYRGFNRHGSGSQGDHQASTGSP